MLLAFSIPVTVIIWSVGTSLVGVICGFVIGRAYTLVREPQKVTKTKSKMLECLQQIVQSTEKLNADVDQHTESLETAKTNVSEIRIDDELTEVQFEILNQISSMVESNRQLETDLAVTKFKLQNYSVELDQTRKDSLTDPLSGLANRKSFDETVAHLLHKNQTSNKRFALIMADIDLFKRINDSYGHLAGDSIIKQIAVVLRQCVRPSDFVGRFGGDEFVLLLDKVKPHECQSIAARIRSTIELNSFEFGNEDSQTCITVSMGLAMSRKEDTKDSLLDRADKALYQSKQRGRNQLHSCIDDDHLTVVKKN